MSNNMHQIQSIKRIMASDEPLKHWEIKGTTYPLKEDLKSWGWYWNQDRGSWCIEALESDPSVKVFEDVEETWIKEI